MHYLCMYGCMYKCAYNCISLNLAINKYALFKKKLPRARYTIALENWGSMRGRIPII